MMMQMSLLFCSVFIGMHACIILHCSFLLFQQQQHTTIASAVVSGILPRGKVKLQWLEALKAALTK